MRGAKEIGMKSEHVKLSSSITETDLISRIAALNNDPQVHGIILQLPLDSGIKTNIHVPFVRIP